VTAKLVRSGILRMVPKNILFCINIRSSNQDDTSFIRVLTQGQKDNALSYVRPELLNTIMGLRTKLLAVIGHGILAGTYLAEYCDSLK